MNAMTMTETIMEMIRDAGAPLEEIVAELNRAVTKAKAKTKGKPSLISKQEQAEKAGPGVHRAKTPAGVYLQKGDNGAGSWIYRYRFNGKRRWMGLGALKDVTLVEAGRRADEARQQVRKGIDPIFDRRAVKAAATRKAAAKWDFKAATSEYLKVNARKWKRRDSERGFRAPLVKYADPVIGRMLLDDIEAAHIVAVMEAAKMGGAPAMADKIRGTIERVINFATASGQHSATRANPAAIKLIGTLSPTGHKGEHYRRISSLDDAAATFRRLMEAAKTSTTLAAWAFMALTAARPSEALGAKWSELDLSKALWIVPAARTKTDKDHCVPLSGLALAVLERQSTVRTSCVVPDSDGASLSLIRQGEDALWQAFFTAAPARRRVFEPSSKHRKRAPAPLPPATA